MSFVGVAPALVPAVVVAADDPGPAVGDDRGVDEAHAVNAAATPHEMMSRRASRAVMRKAASVTSLRSAPYEDDGEGTAAACNRTAKSRG